MQNNFDKLNEIFGIKPKAEPDEAKDKAAEDSGAVPKAAHEPEQEPAGEETKVIKPVRDHEPEPEPKGTPEPVAAPEPASEPEKEAEAEQQTEEAPEEKRVRHSKGPLGFIDNFIYDPKKHEQEAENAQEQPPEPPEDDYDEDDEPLEERDFRPIRRRRDGKIGCLGGMMYFAFVVSLSIILACLGWMAASDVLALNKPLENGTVTLPQSIFTEKEIEVENDDGTTTTKTVMSADMDYVADALKSAGLIEYKSLFKLFCKVVDADIKIDPGTYELNTKCDYNALVLRMQTASASMVATTVMFPEGYTMQEIFEKLEEEGICTVEELMDAAANYSYNYSFLDWTEPGDASRLEGYLFPDTYEFYQGMQASSAINKFLLNFHGKLTADMYTQAENLGISLHEAVIVASMIEAEAGSNDERSLIASVIYNRLEAGMPLQIDATVMYALGEHKEQLTAEDLQVDSPYNTYVNTGLPAGPICNPGLASINAALNPSNTNYLYYALDKETGTHQFFTNYSEFEAFIATQDYSSN